MAPSSYNDGGLTAGTTYYYVVTAEDNGTNESSNSNEASATPTLIILLSDGFEGTPWDLYWGDGTTDWQPGAGYGGSTYSAEHASGDTYLTSDNLDTSDAASITVSFWFNMKLLNKGPLWVQIYNDNTSMYDDWFDLVSYAGGVKSTWLYFSETIAGSDYFSSNFSISFDGSTLTTDAFIDDVLIEKN